MLSKMIKMQFFQLNEMGIASSENIKMKKDFK